MIRKLSQVLMVSLFLVISYSLSEAQFPLYNPYLGTPYLNQIILSSGYPATPTAIPNQSLSVPAFSIQDYYAAYPYLQPQNWTTSQYGNSTTTGTQYNTSGSYVTNGITYAPGYPVTIGYAYQPSNYQTQSSNTYQTVSIYQNSNTANTQQQVQAQASTTGTYIPAYIPAGVPLTTTQPVINNQPSINTLPVQRYLPLPYIQLPISAARLPVLFPQQQTYFPVNTYNPAQVASQGYYIPNANYWPNAEIVDPGPPADIEGTYKGEWESDTTGDDGELCAEIDQSDTQVDGEIKLKEYVISVEGKADLTGTVSGNTVTLEIDLDGPILEFVGVVQSNGDIEGTYTVEGSSGTVLDEGTITFEPK